MLECTFKIRCGILCDVGQVIYVKNEEELSKLGMSNVVSTKEITSIPLQENSLKVNDTVKAVKGGK